MEVWRKNLYALWLAQFLSACAFGLILPFLPFFVRELGITELNELKKWSGIVVAAPYTVAIFFSPMWGTLGDRYGRKPMILRAMGALFIVHFLIGLVQNVHQLILLRIIQGTIAGFAAPGTALMASSAPQEKTGMTLGTLHSSLVSGMVIGPMLGGILADLFGYRYVFFITSALFLVSTIIVFITVKEDFKKSSGIKPSFKKNILFLMGSARLRVLIIIIVLNQVTLQIVGPFLSLFVESLGVTKGFIATITGLVFGITGVTNALFSPFWGRKGDSIGQKWVLSFALILTSIFFIPQAFVKNASQLFFLRLLLGVSLAGIMPTINTIFSLSTKAEDRGGVFGITQSGFLLGNLIGPLIGSIVAAAFGLRSIFITAAIISFGSYFLWKIQKTN